MYKFVDIDFDNFNKYLYDTSRDRIDSLKDWGFKMNEKDKQMLDEIKRKLGFDPTNKEELNKAWNDYYRPILQNEWLHDDRPSIWSVLTLKESNFLIDNNLVAFK